MEMTLMLHHLFLSPCAIVLGRGLGWAHGLPSHISKMVLYTVKSGPLFPTRLLPNP